MGNIGWIKLYRKVLDNDLWNEETFSKCQAWIDLLLMAEYEPVKRIKNYQELRIERGEVLITERELVARWGWSSTKVRNFLNALEGQKMIVQKKARIGTVLTIENYSIYQDIESDEKAEEKAQKKHEKSTEKVSTSYKEYKEVKEDKNIARPRARDIPPDIDDVKAYILEKNYNVDAEQWFDFYQSKGWLIGKSKMKDWKSAVRTWERNNRSRPDYEKPKVRNEVLEMLKEGNY